MGSSFKKEEIVKRYSKAFFSFVGSEYKLEQLEKDVLKFLEMLDSDAEVLRLLTLPFLASEQHKILYLAVAQKYNFSEIVTKFYFVLIKNKRINLTRDILCEILELVALERKQLKVHITTAMELNATQKKSITSSLEKKIAFTIIPDFKVNKAIIAGMIVQINSELYDASLASRLKKFERIAREELAAL